MISEELAKKIIQRTKMMVNYSQKSEISELQDHCQNDNQLEDESEHSQHVLTSKYVINQYFDEKNNIDPMNKQSNGRNKIPENSNTYCLNQDNQQSIQQSEELIVDDEDGKTVKGDYIDLVSIKQKERKTQNTQLDNRNKRRPRKAKESQKVYSFASKPRKSAKKIKFKEARESYQKVNNNFSPLLIKVEVPKVQIPEQVSILTQPPSLNRTRSKLPQHRKPNGKAKRQPIYSQVSKQKHSKTNPKDNLNTDLSQDQKREISEIVNQFMTDNIKMITSTIIDQLSKWNKRDYYNVESDQPRQKFNDIRKSRGNIENLQSFESKSPYKKRIMNQFPKEIENQPKEPYKFITSNHSKMTQEQKLEFVEKMYKHLLVIQQTNKPKMSEQQLKKVLISNALNFLQQMNVSQDNQQQMMGLWIQRRNYSLSLKQ